MKQLNNKILLVVLLVLTGIFIFTKVFRSPLRESNLDTTLTGIDTSKVTEIKVYPVAENQEEIRLSKTGSSWLVSHGEYQVAAEPAAVTNLLQSVSSFTINRLVTSNSDKWSDFSVNDSSATRLVVLGGKETLGEWWIGKNSYLSGAAATYIRAVNEDHVYAVEGTLSFTANKEFSHWRDKTFLKIKKDTVDRIHFQYPGDSSFVLEKKNNVWMIDVEKADSIKVDRYLNRLQSKSISTFAEEFSPSGQPDVVITFESNGNTLSSVKAWKREENWILSSSLQENTYFTSNDHSAKSDLLWSGSEFSPNDVDK